MCGITNMSMAQGAERAIGSLKSQNGARPIQEQQPSGTYGAFMAMAKGQNAKKDGQTSAPGHLNVPQQTMPGLMSGSPSPGKQSNSSMRIVP